MKAGSNLQNIKLWIAAMLASASLIFCPASIAAGSSEQNTQQSIDDIANLIRSNPQLQQELSLALGKNPAPAPNNASASLDAAAKQKIAANTQKMTLQQEIEGSAFNAVKKEAFPLSPDQIIELRDTLDDTQRAQATDPYERTPEPTSSSLLVNLSPGSTPPVIRMARGFVTSLVFIDSTGAPWPIKAYDLGNPNAFNISWNQKDNTLFVQALSTYTYGNLAVVLQNLDTPVMLTLVPGQRVVDYRVDLRMNGLGPKAKPAIGGIGLPGQADPTLLSILDGIPPKDAKSLVVENNAAQAWVIGEKIYVRSLYTVVSPAWVGKMSSADGMNAYVMQRTPMLLLSRYGKIAQIRLEGF